MYRLCYEKPIIPTTHTDFIPYEFSFDTNALLEANSILLRCQKIYNQIKYVEDAYKEFIDYKATVRVPAIETNMALERKARSFFLEFDIFLDHWNKYMSYRGKKEEFKVVFEKATHDAFDSSDNYALAAMLRNYIAHSSDVIQGQFWGGNDVYDVGCSKEVLLADSTFNKTKKEIIKRQPAQIISLTPIMAGAIEKLREIHKVFLGFDFGEEEISAAKLIVTAVDEFRNAKLEDRKWRFENSQKLPMMTVTAEGQPIESILATEYHDFNWRSYEDVLQYLLK